MDHREWARWWKKTGEAQLRELLLKSWDPLRVSDEPLGFSEYDRYLPQIFSKLRAGAAEAEIRNYLRWIVTERMGFEHGSSEDEKTAREVISWYAEAVESLEERQTSNERGG